MGRGNLITGSQQEFEPRMSPSVGDQARRRPERPLLCGTGYLNLGVGVSSMGVGLFGCGDSSASKL
jgi:hypothetical protein